MCEYTSWYVYYVLGGTHGVQKRASNSLELNLEEVISHKTMGVGNYTQDPYNSNNSHS